MLTRCAAIRGIRFRSTELLGTHRSSRAYADRSFCNEQGGRR